MVNWSRLGLVYFYSYTAFAAGAGVFAVYLGWNMDRIDVAVIGVTLVAVTINWVRSARENWSLKERLEGRSEV